MLSVGREQLDIPPWTAAALSLGYLQANNAASVHGLLLSEDMRSDRLVSVRHGHGIHTSPHGTVGFREEASKHGFPALPLNSPAEARLSVLGAKPDMQPKTGARPRLLLA